MGLGFGLHLPHDYFASHHPSDVPPSPLPMGPEDGPYGIAQAVYDGHEAGRAIAAEASSLAILRDRVVI